jgi:hypothetical protein
MKVVDLVTLSVRLDAISETIQGTEDLPTISKACHGLLKLLDNPSNFYFQFVHGGWRTGFRYSSNMILVNSDKIIAKNNRDLTSNIP